jgi:pimeloyl-ACP methyl ester carboxylesterase
MRETLVSSGDAELAITEWGEKGLPILALHPGVGDSRIWQWCAPAWADAGHRVVAYDRRGFGETRYKEEPHDDVSDLLAVTAATASRPAVLVGNSRGGGLALDVALAHPDHVAALVLIAPAPSGYPYDDWTASAAETEQDALMAAAVESGDIELVNRLEVRYWLDGTEQPDGRVQGPARDLMLDMNRRALQSAPVGDPTAHAPAWPHIGDVAVPVLVVGGQHDLPGMAELCSRLIDGLPDGRLVALADSAHCPSLDQPERLVEVVLGFLDSLDR